MTNQETEDLRALQQIYLESDHEISFEEFVRQQQEQKRKDD